MTQHEHAPDVAQFVHDATAIYALELEQRILSSVADFVLPDRGPALELAYSEAAGRCAIFLEIASRVRYPAERAVSYARDRADSASQLAAMDQAFYWGMQ